MESIYLDNASTTFPKPERVARSVYRHMTEGGVNVGRGGYALAYRLEERVFETRELLRELFGAQDCKDVVFTKNATESLNVLLKGLLRPGDHVLVSSMEHNAVMRPLTQLQSAGCAFTRVPCDAQGELRLDALEGCLTPRTRAVVMTHASNVCGTALPISAVGRFCRERGLLFIADCAQSAGVLPIDMRAMGLSALAFTGHKGLYGPQGIGGFVLSPGMAERLEPLIAGGTGSLSHEERMPGFMPDRFEAGTLNLPGIVGLREGLLFLREVGIDSVRAHELELTERFLRGLEPLARAGKVRVLGKRSREGRTGVVSIMTPGADQAHVAHRLAQEYGIMTRVGLHCAPAAHRALGSYPTGAIRFSFGWYNDERHVAAAIDALGAILADAGERPTL